MNMYINQFRFCEHLLYDTARNDDKKEIKKNTEILPFHLLLQTQVFLKAIFRETYDFDPLL